MAEEFVGKNYFGKEKKTRKMAKGLESWLEWPTCEKNILINFILFVCKIILFFCFGLL